MFTRSLIISGLWFLGLGAAALAVIHTGWWIAPAVLLLASAALGTWDLIQKQHTILRVFPILGHVRFLMESIRPEIRQYFIESNTEAAPFDRETRDMVYERAKGTKNDQPFGTERDVNRVGHEFLCHSLRARFPHDMDPGIRLGGSECSPPYDIALLNVSAMSFGALSAHAIEALSAGAARGGAPMTPARAGSAHITCAGAAT